MGLWRLFDLTDTTNHDADGNEYHVPHRNSTNMSYYANKPCP
jgi:hypothetical protein